MDSDFDPAGYLGGILGSPVQITSGLRSTAKNAAVGGVPNSAHLSGLAYDFVPKGMDTKTAAAKLAASGIPFDQIEDGGDHVHISFDPKNRRQIISPKMANVSDDDLLNAIGSSQASPQGNVSDDQLLDAIGSQTGTSGAHTASGGNGATTKPNAAAASRPSVNPVVDAIRTLPGGLVKGASAIAGLPGDLNSLLDYAANKITGNNISTTQLPTSQGITNAVTAPFGGAYTPQTTLGKYVDTAAQFAPAALFPGSAGLRAARVLAPAIGSETAGEMFPGGTGESIARFAGALAGGGAVGGARELMTQRPAIPTTQQIRTAATAAYRQADQAGVSFSENSIHNLGNDIAQAVDQAGIDPTLHPRATAALNRIVNSTGDLSFNRLQILRRVANSAAASPDADEARLAHVILDHIDNFAEAPPAGAVLSGNSQQASDAITQARRLWAQQARSDELDTLVERARNRAEVVSGSGIENALRVEFRGLAQNAGRMARFSDAEQDAIRQVARGGPIGNIARTLGKLAPTNLIAILGEMGAISADPKAVAVPILGATARTLSTALTRRNVNAASALVRSGGAVPQGPNVLPETLSALLARNRQQQQQEPVGGLLPAYQ